jgi:bacteriocin biosynthesis cyclodehydratase domain-containing protein
MSTDRGSAVAERTALDQAPDRAADRAPDRAADRPLPARLRLRPHRTVLRLGPDARLLGLDPGCAVAVERLPGALATMLDELTDPVDTVALLLRAVERGADPAVAEALLGELMRIGAVIDASILERRDRQRAASTVVIIGDGPLAVGVVLGLVQAEVGTVHTETAGSVLAADLGTGYLDADRGHERGVATRDAVRRVRPDADARAAPRRVLPDLVVLADALAPDPARVARLHVDGTAHLPVRLRDGIGVIGPLVLPGRSACLHCLELQRRARAPDWPTVAAQLSGRRGGAGAATTAATAALATAQVVAALDAMSSGGARPPTLETSIELDAAAGVLARRRWNPHSECDCGAVGARPAGAGGLRHDTATSADHCARETIMR